MISPAQLARAIALLAASGCGRIGFEAASGMPMPDGGPDARADAAAGGLGPFAPPVRVDELAQGGARRDDPTLTADQLEIFFNRNRFGASEIFTATRASTSDVWGPESPVAELNSAAFETSPEVSGDGLTIYLASNRGSSLDIYVSTRSTRLEAWSDPVLVPEVSTRVTESNATPSEDLLTLTFGRSVVGRDQDIFEATRGAVDEGWSSPTPLDELNSRENDSGAMLSLGGRLIAFDSARRGGGSVDLFFAERPGTSGPFGPVRSHPELDTARAESDPWLSSDGRTLYFTRDDEIFFTTR